MSEGAAPVTPEGDPGRTREVGVAARRAAYDLLLAVGVQDAYANLAMPRILADSGLSGRDAALATEVAFGTLRWRGLYDEVIASAAGREVSRIDPPALDVLRLGCHQILSMRVPVHAAVSTSVDLAKQVCRPAAGFVNAVLRTVGQADRAVWVARVSPDPAADPEGYLAVALSHPRWIVEALKGAIRTTEAGVRDLPRLLAANNSPAPVTLARRSGSTVAEVVSRTGGDRGRWSPWAVRLDGGDPGDLPEVRSGEYGVQDEGSQVVVRALVGAAVEGDAGRWLDMCAGPGGKAALLAAVLGERGLPGSLTALELHSHRVRLVEQALRALPGGHLVRQADARAEGWQPAAYDRVLLDAPCTGLGALRRRPESRWRRSSDDLAALAPLQRELLAAALQAVRPGGVVAYVTCSPHLAETDLVVRDVLRGRPDVDILDAPAVLPDVPAVRDDRFLRTWPHLHDTDGMFLALLRRGTSG